MLLIHSSTFSGIKMKFLVIFLVVSQVSCHLQDMTWVLDMEHISFHPVYDNPESKFVYKFLQAGPEAGMKL